MSATTTRESASDRRLQGRRNDLATVAEKIRKDQSLHISDIFDEAVTGTGLVRASLADCEVDFLARLADVYPLTELRPLIALFDRDEARSWWEESRRAAAAAVILYLREQANQVSRILKRGPDGPWVFLGYKLRNTHVLRLSETQCTLTDELDFVVELWARKDNGFVQVWFNGQNGTENIQAAPTDITEDPHLIEARKRYQMWLAQA